MVNIDLVQMMKGAMTAIETCANVGTGENVLIVTDTDMDLMVAVSLASAVYAVNANPAIVIMPPLSRHGEDPPNHIRQAMIHSDVIITPTSRTLFHADARVEACDKGARFLSMTGATANTLKGSAMTADFKKQEPLTKALADRLTKADMLELFTDAGTDLKASVQGRVGIAQPGIAKMPGEAIGIPNIEANVAPIENSANGKVVIDATVTHFGLPDRPVTITFEHGKAVKLEGGEKAQKLAGLLQSANDPNQYYLAEVGLGLNPKAELCGSIIDDEAVMGTAHIALGDNHNQGGQNYAPMHLDLIMKDVTLRLDGETVIEKGDVLIKPHT